MTDIKYINTQDIRKDLVGFLKSLESGQPVAVMNRSKVVAHLNKKQPDYKKGGIKQMLETADIIHQTVKPGQKGLGSSESYKERYHKDVAKKYDLS